MVKCLPVLTFHIGVTRVHPALHNQKDTSRRSGKNNEQSTQVTVVTCTPRSGE